MTPQNMHSVDEELVAAFVDGDVTAEERQRVEAAMASDEQVAWEVNTLRQTVELLQDLPAVPLPRSFVLTEDQVGDVLLERRSRAIATAAPAAADQDPQDSPWQRFLRFLNGGDLSSPECGRARGRAARSLLRRRGSVATEPGRKS